MSETEKFGLTGRIVIGMIAGIMIGMLLRLFISDDPEQGLSVFGAMISVKSVFIDGIFNVIGQIFIASLRMLVVPLVFISLVCGVCNLSDPKSLGRLGIKSISLYLITTAVAVATAITFALIVSPGEGVSALEASSTFVAKEAPSLSQVIINMFPTNPIKAMAEGNMLQIIVFSLLFGFALALSGQSGRNIISLFNDLNHVVMKLVTILMNLAPYGVFALMARLFAEIEGEMILRLIKYFGLVLTVLLIHGLVTYSILLKLLTGLNPLVFLRKMREAAIFAFSTSSSSATLPVTLETATKKLGVKNSVASFTVPLGATINMDGTAIMQGVATVFIAQVYGQDLTTAQYLMVILTATLASVGTAGVPGVGLIMLAMVLNQVGLPVEGIALIIGVDRLLDMTRTAVNVTGDCMVSCVVAKSEGQLDRETFNDVHADEKAEEVRLEDFKKT